MTELAAMIEELTPGQLINLIESPATPNAQLTYAAEQLGRIGSTRDYLVIQSLLLRESALVREGAIYGLEHLADKAPGNRLETIRIRIRHHTTADNEPSPGVRAAAKDALEL